MNSAVSAPTRGPDDEGTDGISTVRVGALGRGREFVPRPKEHRPGQTSDLVRDRGLRDETGLRCGAKAGVWVQAHRAPQVPAGHRGPKGQVKLGTRGGSVDSSGRRG